ncbi:Glucan endo-1,3-beta-D-glucosidase [Caldicellulosiruptor kronotskyensis 2002]|uniref:Glucan endo-1,3-beta-D-glucosidase n=1 Tax=Caldicellulosiruptor kronotskyensis (strain DSM 18902 / VKM B-2412 / 2002) TaxID=632348 RepID=E4SCD3_CALK2|nr:carbohydrate binding domain-containing protein [Caldicellulosiruptor kronotskyensis]ADQ44988.1 Glucan endo-1,3-beta-D-glucosidase [Caldicellulosiruptor kronotskyensis 2002]
MRVKNLVANILLFAFFIMIIFPGGIAKANSVQIFKDVSTNFAKDDITRFYQLELINGYPDGTFKPAKNTSVAEFCKILNSYMGFVQEAPLDVSLRISPLAWYYRELKKAQAAGYLALFVKEGKINPNRFITRQEAFAAVAAALKLESQKEDILNSFSDVQQIDPRYLPGLAALVSFGFVKGYPDGTLKPEKGITRAEIVKLLSGIGALIATKPGEYTLSQKEGFVIVNSSDVVIKDVSIKGNIYINQSVGEGSVTLNNVTIDGGKLFIFGGGENSVKLVNTKVKEIVVDSKLFKTNIEIGQNSQAENIIVLSSANVTQMSDGSSIKFITLKQSGNQSADVEIKANCETLYVFSPNIKVNIKNSKIKNLIASDLAQNFTLSVSSSKIESVELNSNGNLNIDKESGIEKLIVKALAKDVKINSNGKINEASVYSEGVVLNGKTLSKGEKVDINAVESKQPSSSTAAQNTLPVQFSGSSSSTTGGTSQGSTGAAPDQTGNNNQNQQGGNQIQPTWQLVWEDDFNSSSIDTTKWNFTIGAGGYGNNELQYYSSRPENARVENGNLIIEARKENFEGSPYTSAKLTTQGKFSFTYGKVEVRAKLPEGQGVWPAIWMMPEDMNLYGGWPVCGEIDIMELLGHEPNKVYGTIHYGNPHTYHGGNYTLPNGQKFSDDFHVFGLEWEPGKIKWYVDGQLYYETSDWFSRSSNEAFDYTYPAPFDREFYLILNVAVGGNWPGYPPKDANYFPQKMVVDWVRVYKKAGVTYPDNVVKPQESITYPQDARPPLSDGNLIYNGSFDQDSPDIDGIEGVANTDYWQFLHLPDFGGDGTIENIGGSVKINIAKPGSQTYSLQLIQRPICLIKGKTYKLTFRAKSEGSRTIEVKFSSGGGDNGSTWIDYAVKTFNLSSDWQDYSYIFTMQSSTYTKARIEFNVGLNNLPVYIDDVKLVEYDVNDPSAVKEPLPNGNLIYNGTFDQGDGRFAAWEFVKETVADATYTIGSKPEDRYFKAIVANGGQNFSDIKLVQSNIKVGAGENLLLSFSAKAFESLRQIKVYISDQNFNPITEVKEVSLSLDWNVYKFNLKSIDNLPSDTRAKLVFEIGASNSDVGIDNVSLKKVLPSSFIVVQAEDFGSISNATNNRQYVAFSQGGAASFSVNIPKSGEYLVSYRLKAGQGSSLKLIVGSIVYDAEVAPISTNWVIVSDTVYLESGENSMQLLADNVDLDYVEFSPNFIKNGDFSKDIENWTTWFGNGGTGAAQVSRGQLKVSITNIGLAFWSIQVIQGPMTLESGKTYRITFDAKSTSARDIFIKIDDSNYYGHLERYVPLTDKMKNYTFDFEMDATRSDIRLVIGLGTMSPGGANPQNQAHTVTIDNVAIAEVSENCGYFEREVSEILTGEAPSEPQQFVGDKLLPDGSFETQEALDNWHWWSSAGNNVAMSIENGELKLSVSSIGSDPWDPQLYRQEIPLVNGKNYKISFKARATYPRKINVAIGKPLTSDPWFIEYMPKKTIDITSEMAQYEIYFAMNNPTDLGAKLAIEIGNVAGYSQVPFDIYFDDIQIEVVDSIPQETVPPAQHTQKVGDQIIPDGTFDTGLGEWVYWSGDQWSGVSDMQVAAENGKLKVHLNSVGWQPYSAQIARKNLTLENGLTYELKFKMNASQNTKIQVNIGKELTSDPWFIPYAPTTVFDIGTQQQEYTLRFKVTQPTDVTKVVFEFGPINGQYPPLPLDIYLDDVTLTVVSDQ